MPERKTRLTQSLKRTSEAAGAKAKRFLRRDIICKFSEVSRAAKQGPGTPRGSGPTPFFGGHRGAAIEAEHRSGVFVSLASVWPSARFLPPLINALGRIVERAIVAFPKRGIENVRLEDSPQR